MAPIELSEDEMNERDARVEQELRSHLRLLEGLAKERLEEARALRHRADRLRQEVKAERWYNVEGLSSDDVESLCNVSPTDLLSEEA